MILITSYLKDKYGNIDLAMNFIHSYLMSIRKQLIEKGKYPEDIIELFEENDTRENVEKALKEYPIKICLFHGHGLEDKISGHMFDIIIDPENVHLLKDRDVYALSCLTGYSLAYLSIKAGAKSYLGYEREVVFLISDEDPQKDDMFAYFVPIFFLPTVMYLTGERDPVRIYMATYYSGKMYVRRLLQESARVRDPELRAKLKEIAKTIDYDLDILVLYTQERRYGGGYLGPIPAGITLLMAIPFFVVPRVA